MAGDGALDPGPHAQVAWALRMSAEARQDADVTGAADTLLLKSAADRPMDEVTGLVTAFAVRQASDDAFRQIPGRFSRSLAR